MVCIGLLFLATLVENTIGMLKLRRRKIAIQYDIASQQNLSHIEESTPLPEHCISEMKT